MAARAAISAIGDSSSESDTSEDETGEADAEIDYATSAKGAKFFHDVEEEDPSAFIAELDQQLGAIGEDLHKMWRIAKNSDEETDGSSFLTIKEENDSLRAFILEAVDRVQTNQMFNVEDLEGEVDMNEDEAVEISGEKFWINLARSSADR